MDDIVVINVNTEAIGKIADIKKQRVGEEKGIFLLTLILQLLLMALKCC